MDASQNPQPGGLGFCSLNLLSSANSGVFFSAHTSSARLTKIPVEARMRFDPFGFNISTTGKLPFSRPLSPHPYPNNKSI